MKRRSTNFKVLIISIVMALLFLIVGANVFVVGIKGYHINSKTQIHELIEGIHVVDKTLFADRGDITDRNNNIIATNKKAFTLYAIVDEKRINSSDEAAYVEDKEGTAEKISDVIGEEYQVVLNKLTEEGVSQVEFGKKGKKLSQDQKETLESYDLPGLGFFPILTRHYPNKNFASSLLGISLYDETVEQLTGRFGIELNFDDYLKGSNGFKTYQQDKDGYILPQVKVLEEKAIDGSTVKLTLDRPIQEILEMELKNLTENQNIRATESWGAVMEAKTGKIVAWSDYPNFDPNLLDIDSYQNKGSQYTYEPGSTMKSFTVAAAIEEGVYNGDEIFDSSSFYVGSNNGKPYRLPNSTGSVAKINNVNGKDWGHITYDRGFDESSNVMIAELLSNKLDVEVYHDYMHRLGFYKNVNTDSVPENAGIDLWDGAASKITNGFGQGSTVTMLQMMQAYSSVVTDGTMVKPYFIDEIINQEEDEVLYSGGTKVVGKPFKQSTALQVRDMMRTVVNGEFATASRFDIDEIEVIAKTGTAQMVADGGYSESEYIFSSTLAFPYNDPEYIFYFAYVAGIGNSIGESAGHMNNVVRKVVSSNNLQNEYSEKVIESTQLDHLGNYVNMSSAAALKDLQVQGYKVNLLGDGETVLDQYPKANKQILSNELIMLYTDSATIKMPDMNDWSHKEVTAFWRLTGIEVNLVGSGYVFEQSLPIDQILNKDDIITVKLK